MEVSVHLSYISAEKLWEHGKPLPPGVHISTNVNIVGVETRDEKLAVPFVVTISYTPSIAQVSMKGQAVLSGEQTELREVQESYKKKHAPPPILLQTITNASLVEATVLSRTLNIPPPIPLPTLPKFEPKKEEKPSYVG